jgi:hypothetical protein
MQRWYLLLSSVKMFPFLFSFSDDKFCAMVFLVCLDFVHLSFSLDSHEGHWFCYECIMNCLQAQEICPISQQPLFASQIFPNRVAQTIVSLSSSGDLIGLLSLSVSVCHCLSSSSSPSKINNLLVRCPTHSLSLQRDSDACSWTGRLALEEDHLRECQYALVSCENQCRGCDVSTERRSYPNLKILTHFLA